MNSQRKNRKNIDQNQEKTKNLISFNSRPQSRAVKSKFSKPSILFQPSNYSTAKEIRSFLKAESEQSFLISKAQIIKKTYKSYVFRKRLLKFFEILRKSYKHTKRFALQLWYLAIYPPANLALPHYLSIRSTLSDWYKIYKVPKNNLESCSSSNTNNANSTNNNNNNNASNKQNDGKSYYYPKDIKTNIDDDIYESTNPNIHFCSFSEYMTTNSIFSNPRYLPSKLKKSIRYISFPFLLKSIKEWSQSAVTHLILFSNKPELRQFALHRINFGCIFTYYNFWRKYFLYHKFGRFELVTNSIYLPEFSWYRGRKLREKAMIKKANQFQKLFICPRVIRYLHHSTIVSKNCRTCYDKIVPIFNMGRMKLVKTAFFDLVIAHRMNICILRRLFRAWYSIIDLILIKKNSIFLFSKHFELRQLSIIFKKWKIFIKHEQQTEAFCYSVIHENRGFLMKYAFVFLKDNLHFLVSSFLQFWLKTVLLKRRTKKIIQWSFHTSKSNALKSYIFSLFRVKAKIQINKANFQPFRVLFNSSQIPQSQSQSISLENIDQVTSNQPKKAPEKSDQSDINEFKTFTSSTRTVLMALKNIDIIELDNSEPLHDNNDNNTINNFNINDEITKEIIISFHKKKEENDKIIPNWSSNQTSALLYQLILGFSRKDQIIKMPSLRKDELHAFLIKNNIQDDLKLISFLQSQDDEAANSRVKMSAYLFRDQQLISTFLSHSAALELNKVIAFEKTAPKTGRVRALTPSAAIAIGIAKAPVTRRRGAQSGRRRRRQPREIDFSVEPTSSNASEIEKLPVPIHIPRPQVESSRGNFVHPLLSSFEKAKKDIIIDQRLYQRQPSDIFQPKAIPKLYHTLQNLESSKGVSQRIRPSVTYDIYNSSISPTSELQKSLIKQTFHLQELQSLQEEAFTYEKAHHRLSFSGNISPQARKKSRLADQKQRQSLSFMPLLNIEINEEIKKLADNEKFTKLQTEGKVEVLLKRYFDLLIFLLGEEAKEEDMNLSQKISFALKLLGDDSPPTEYRYVEYPKNIGSLMNEKPENISWIISEIAAGKTNHQFEECIAPAAGAFFSAIVNGAQKTRNIVEKYLGPLKGIDRFDQYDQLVERIDKGIIPKMHVHHVSFSQTTKLTEKIETPLNDSPSKKSTPKKKPKRAKLTSRSVSKPAFLSASKSSTRLLLEIPNGEEKRNFPLTPQIQEKKSEDSFNFQTQAPITVPQARFFNSDDKHFFLCLTPYIMPPVILLKFL